MRTSAGAGGVHNAVVRVSDGDRADPDRELQSTPAVRHGGPYSRRSPRVPSKPRRDQARLTEERGGGHLHPADRHRTSGDRRQPDEGTGACCSVNRTRLLHDSDETRGLPVVLRLRGSLSPQSAVETTTLDGTTVTTIYRQELVHSSVTGPTTSTDRWPADTVSTLVEQSTGVETGVRPHASCPSRSRRTGRLGRHVRPRRNEHPARSPGGRQY